MYFLNHFGELIPVYNLEILEGTWLRDIRNVVERETSVILLKEQCHKDFAVLGQFCAELITLRLKS